jgi:hypothetical protein
MNLHRCSNHGSYIDGLDVVATLRRIRGFENIRLNRAKLLCSLVLLLRCKDQRTRYQITRCHNRIIAFDFTYYWDAFSQ